MEKRSQRLGQLLKAGLNSISTIEGKTGSAVDEEIGALVGLSGTSLQRYRSGAMPDDRFARLVAEACVRRGMMGRPWLERFLNAAHFPHYEAQALIAQLFPDSSPPRPPTARSNLPPAHGRFIMRQAAYDATLAGLRSATPLTVIVSLGGMGKSSLARAVAADCLAGRVEPAFPIVAWISDKDRPGTTSLNSALDEIARVLDYPGLISLPFAEKRRTLEGLLREHPTLLVLDNAETIGDAALLEWVSQMPAPSKALATSRAGLSPYIPHRLVELDPLDATEARELIAERLAQSGWRARIDWLPQLLPLAEVAGGNPKAIELALSLVLRQNRPLEEAVRGLRGAGMAELFDDLFAQAWALLGADARLALLAITLFAGSAAESALAACTDLAPDAVGHVFGQLVDLSLLDAERSDLNALSRYSAHPLVRAFASTRLTADPVAEAELRDRWLRWCVDIGESVGFCWFDLGRLARLDNEHETLQVALEWSTQCRRDSETLALCEGLRYYYNVHGLWDSNRRENYARRRQAAYALGNISTVVLALTQEAEVLSKQSILTSAAALLHEAEQLVLRALDPAALERWHTLPPDEQATLIRPADLAAREILTTDAAFELGHAQALLAYTSGDASTAEDRWRAMLPFSATLEAQKYIINRRWLATCLLDQGRSDEAAALYHESLADARRANDTRSVTGNTLKLAAIDLARGDLDAAAAALAECYAVAARYADRRRLAEYHRLTAQLQAAQGDYVGMRQSLATAADLFARMGMRRQADDTQKALAHEEEQRMNQAQRPAVGVSIIIRDDDRVLLGLRTAGHGAGTWQFPGGHLEFGESIEECGRREAREETGLAVANVRLGPYTNDIFAEGLHYITLFVIAKHSGGTPEVREPDKCARWEWFSWDMLPSPLFLPVENLRKKGFRLSS